MGNLIDIHQGGHEIDLEIGRYKIDVLGGWGIKLGRFSISFVHTRSGRTVSCERSSWPIQTFTFGKRAKQLFTVAIVESGVYQIVLENPETLKVKHSNLFFSALFQPRLPIESISIHIH